MGKRNGANIVLNMIFIALCSLCVFPLLLTVSISLSSSSAISEYGYTLIPKVFSLESYRYLGVMKAVIARAYGVTIFSTVAGTAVSTLVISLYAYPLSRKDFKYRGFFTFYVFFTMLFSGGTVAWYIICTRYLHLSDTVWALIVPHLMNAWYVIIMKTFFSTSVPASVIESAKLDGAGEFRIFFALVMPISVPGIATIALFQCLGYWNDWWLALMFITDSRLYNLQFLLKSLLGSIEALRDANQIIEGGLAFAKIPREGVRMAMCIIVAGPILVVYPFFQKYFIKGLTVGAVKG